MASKMLLYHGCLVYIDRGKDADGEMTTGFEATGENGLVIAGGYYNRKMTDNEILRELEVVLADRAAHPEDYETGVSSDDQKGNRMGFYVTYKFDPCELCNMPLCDECRVTHIEKKATEFRDAVTDLERQLKIEKDAHDLDTYMMRTYGKLRLSPMDV